MTKEEIKNYIAEELANEEPEIYLDADDYKVILEAISAEPCGDCISRQAALDAFGLSEKTRKYGGDHSGYDTLMMYEIQDTLEDLPPATPAPKTGRWKNIYNKSGTPVAVRCTACGKSPKRAIKSDFCPKCGAKMVEPQESEENNADSN